MAEPLLLINPRRRRKTVSRNPRRRRAVNPLHAARKRYRRKIYATNPRRRTRRYRRNPAPALNVQNIVGMFTDALQGAVGGVALNATWNLLPLPAMLKTGLPAHLTKGLVAIGLGAVARPVLGRVAGKMAEGALTITMYEAVKDVAGQMGMPLGYYTPVPVTGALPQPSQQNVSEYVDAYVDAFNAQGTGAGMGEYVYQ
jgi:hypothetical protein